MANKIQLTLDLARIDKTRIKNRTYTNKDGQEVTVKEYVIEAVEMIQPKTIKEGDTWILQQTHFVTDAPTKEERQAKAKMNTIGKGTGFLNKTDESSQEIKASITRKLKGEEYPEEDINPEDIPF